MAAERIVVGATGEDGAARVAAHRLRDEGHEIVFVGGQQTPEHLVRTAVAEDASRIVVDASDRDLERIVQVRERLEAGDVHVEPLV